jgi:pyrimidine deaminase RibD-like protein
MAFTNERIQELCELAIVEAKKSVREDERAHPLVGALLVDGEGVVVATSYRGEAPKRHAEFSLLEKATGLGVNVEGCTLFVTLEPCIRRGHEKVPCAVRVAAAGIKSVYIGTLDPDPRITGRGEMYLTYEGVSVEHFPRHLAEELRDANKAFFDRFRAAHFWDPPPRSLYGADEAGLTGRPQAARTREGILYQTLDLIAGSDGAIWISAGDLSWLRELQVALIGAALDKRDVRLLQHGTKGGDLASVATHLGISVLERTEAGRTRFTIVGAKTPAAAAIVVEKGHALLLRMPDEEGLLGVLADWFDRSWTDQQVHRPHEITIRQIGLDAVIAALRSHVQQYKRLPIAVEDVALNVLRPASRKLESFKLFRIHQFAALRARHGLPDFACVVGSPWPLIGPPLIERLPDRSLVLIDGTHRAYSARARGETTIRAIVVDNPNFDLPSQPAPSWTEVDILAEKLPRAERYSKFDSGLFRPIRAAFESLAVP